MTIRISRTWNDHWLRRMCEIYHTICWRWRICTRNVCRTLIIIRSVLLGCESKTDFSHYEHSESKKGALSLSISHSFGPPMFALFLSLSVFFFLFANMLRLLQILLIFALCRRVWVSSMCELFMCDWLMESMATTIGYNTLTHSCRFSAPIQCVYRMLLTMIQCSAKRWAIMLRNMKIYIVLNSLLLVCPFFAAAFSSNILIVIVCCVNDDNGEVQ